MLNTDRLCTGCMRDNEGEQICPICGYDSSLQNPQNCLPAKFWLADRYMVGKVLSENPESITYIGWDNNTDTTVNIKEYFPSTASTRNPDKTVSIKAGTEFIFNEGLMNFIELNNKLKSLEIPAVTSVLSVFEENGTAYAVTASFTGITLEDFLNRNGSTLKWEQARSLFLPLIDALKSLHEANIIHAGISPETIYVGRDGKLKLTEFSINALRTNSGKIPSCIYDGFSAIEQYDSSKSIDERTDVYGLCATLFRVLIGNAPAPALQRAQQDKTTVPAHFADELPRQVLVAIANGMQVDPSSRTASVEVFKNELVYGETQENYRKSQSAARVAKAETQNKGNQKKNSSARYAVIASLVTILVFVIAAVVLSLTVLKDFLFGANKNRNVNSDVISVPSMTSVGDYDSDAVESKTLYEVPDFLGKFYSQVTENEENDKFKFDIKGKVYSDKYERGMICAQSVEAGKNVEKETKISFTISLGPKEVKIANVVGLEEAEAKIELLKQGFLYDNIKIVEMYEAEAKPGIILKQTPAYQTIISPDEQVTINVNRYEGELENNANQGDSAQASGESVPANGESISSNSTIAQ